MDGLRNLSQYGSDSANSTEDDGEALGSPSHGSYFELLEIGFAGDRICEKHLLRLHLQVWIIFADCFDSSFYFSLNIIWV